MHQFIILEGLCTVRRMGEISMITIKDHLNNSFRSIHTVPRSIQKYDPPPPCPAGKLGTTLDHKFNNLNFSYFTKISMASFFGVFEGGFLAGQWKTTS